MRALLRRASLSTLLAATGCTGAQVLDGAAATCELFSDPDEDVEEECAQRLEECGVDEQQCLSDGLLARTRMRDGGAACEELLEAHEGLVSCLLSVNECEFVCDENDRCEAPNLEACADSEDVFADARSRAPDECLPE